jgi:hypothetical protein
METILISLVCLALIVMSTVTMTISLFQSENGLVNSWKIAEAQASSMRQTEIAASAPQDYQGGAIDLEIENEGHVDLSDFPKWDVIVQYESGTIRYLTYTASYPPGNNQWTVKGIYVSDGSPEVFDQNILNPGESMIATINLSPEIGQGEMVRVTVCTPNGITSQCYVTRRSP